MKTGAARIEHTPDGWQVFALVSRRDTVVATCQSEDKAKAYARGWNALDRPSRARA